MIQPMRCKRCQGRVDRPMVVGNPAELCTWCLAIELAKELALGEREEASA